MKVGGQSEISKNSKWTISKAIKERRERQKLNSFVNINLAV